MVSVGLDKEIAAKFSELSPQLQLAARYILDRPDDVALMSMRSLASNAGVHPSTMVRLAKIFGCNSFQDFRAPFQHRLRARPEGYLERARDLQSRGADQTQVVLAANLENLRQTFSINTPERFESCAQTLAGARQIYVVGLRGMFPVASFFHYAYSMFSDNCVLVDGRGGAFIDGLRNFDDRDVILAISFDPYTRETVSATELAKSRGGKAVVLTDSQVSPLAAFADQMLVIKNESPSFFHSVAAAVTAAEELIALLMAEGGQAALDAIEESEALLAQFHAYWVKKPEARMARVRRKRTRLKPRNNTKESDPL